MLQNLQNKQNNVMKIIILYLIFYHGKAKISPFITRFFKVKINLFEFSLYARLYISFKI